MDVCQLFGNIEAVFDFNRQFYLLLDSCRLDMLRMAKCFVDKEKGFDVYADYCTQYPKMVSTLNRLCATPPVLDFLRERQLDLRHSLPLGPYLLKPVQRVLKYHLFLQSTLKHWDHSKTSERKEIQRALECMTGRAQHINEVKKRQEHALRVQEIQRTLLSWKDCGSADLTQYGELVLESCFRVSGSKAVRRVILFEEMLLITKDKQDGTLICKDFIMCSNLMLVESVPGDPLAFQVLSFDNPKSLQVFQARNGEQKSQWTQELKRLMLEHFSAEIPTRAKEILMTLPSTKKTDEDLPEVSKNGRRQHPVPKYLEKRRKSADTSMELSVLRKHKNCVRSVSVNNLSQNRSSFPTEEVNMSASHDCGDMFRSLANDEKRNQQMRVQKFFEHRKFAESRTPQNLGVSRLLPSKLRRHSKSPSSARNEENSNSMGVKSRTLARTDGGRRKAIKHTAKNLREDVDGLTLRKSSAPILAKNVREKTSATLAVPTEGEKKYFESSDLLPKSGAPFHCHPTTSTSIEGRNETSGAGTISAKQRKPVVCRVSTGSSSGDSAYGSRHCEGCSDNSAGDLLPENDHVTSWLHACRLHSAKVGEPKTNDISANNSDNKIEENEVEKSGIEDIEKAYADLWEELKEFANNSAESKSPKKQKFPTEKTLEKGPIIKSQVREIPLKKLESPSAQSNASQTLKHPGNASGVQRRYIRNRPKARSHSRERATDSRTLDALNRLSDLLKIDATKPSTVSQRRPIELGSKLERIRPARPERCQETANTLQKARSLGNLVSPPPPKPISRDLFRNSCSDSSSQESLYDTVYECNLEKQLDVLHAWDSAVASDSDDWAEWMLGEDLANQQWMDAEFGPLRAYVDIGRSVKAWEEKMKRSRVGVGEGGGGRKREEGSEKSRVKHIVRNWGISDGDEVEIQL